ncbi:MAG: ABC-F family ATP-binding cassette domain-containing protein [Acidobacteria bacterium]|nr:ABC-F family ATP-binding cassette domain-containing protein [Acidobacteriota bacterium]
MLQARGLSVEVGGRLTLADASFTVRAGDIVGLVGRNGAGKTSLLRVLAGQAPAHGGLVTVTGRLGYLDQDPRSRPEQAAKRVLDHVLSGRGIDELVERMEKLRLRMEEAPTTANVARHARAHDEYEREGGYAADAEARRIVAGLGLSADRLELPLGVLSGGERRRAELARILFAGSDVLLLDEPTNHLDTDAKVWLTGFLRGYRGALVVVSHDIELLDEAITRVLHLDEADVVEYRGTYTQYVAARAADEVRLAKQAEAQATEVKRLQTLVDRFGAKASKASMAHSVEKRIVRIQREGVDAPKRKQQAIAVRLPEPPHSGRVVLEVESITKSYGGPPIFSDIDFALERGERLMIMGLNGAGKTSLLRIIAGRSDQDAGEVRFGLNVSAGYYAQEHENVDGSRDLLSHIQEAADQPLAELRGLLGMYGLSGDKAFQDAGTLSGGEKTKLSLAMLTAGRHNLLLLDEPTNNLDPPSRTAVAHALAGWKGTMVLVSHDPDFVRELAPQRVLLMPDGTLDYWSDDLLDLVSMA